MKTTTNIIETLKQQIIANCGFDLGHNKVESLDNMSQTQLEFLVEYTAKYTEPAIKS